MIYILGMALTLPLYSTAPEYDTNVAKQAVIETVKERTPTSAIEQKNLRQIRSEAMAHPKVQEALEQVRNARSEKEKNKAISNLIQVVRRYVTRAEQNYKERMQELNTYTPKLSVTEQAKVGSIYERVYADGEVKEVMQRLVAARGEPDREVIRKELRQLIAAKITKEEQLVIDNPKTVK